MPEFTPQQSVRREELIPEPLPRKGDEDRLLRWLGRFRDKFTAHAREARKRLDEIIAGKVNWVGIFNLTDDGVAIATVVQDNRVTSDCQISLQPLTALSAAALVTTWIGAGDLRPGTPWAASPVGEFTVNHAATVDKIAFRYSIKG